MNSLLQLDNIGQQVAEYLHQIDGKDILPLLTKYQLLPSLAREMIIDVAISSIECTPEEEELALERLSPQYQKLAEKNPDNLQIKSLTIRQLKLEKFKKDNWGTDLNSYFLQYKPLLNRVVFSLISHPDIGVCQEIYFRIQEGEQSFAELAQEYSQEPEAQTGGLIRPVELRSLRPSIGRILSVIQIHQLIPPTPIENSFAIVRLEKLIPAQLDAHTRQRLLDECFNKWLQSQINTQNW